MKTFHCTATALLIFLFACAVKSQTNADAAWQEVQQAAQLPPAPAEWNTRQPTSAEIHQYDYHVAGAAMVAAKKAKAFYMQFPDNVNINAARKLEWQMLRVAFLDDGQTPASYAALQNAGAAWLAVPGLTADDRFTVQVDLAESKRSDPNTEWSGRDAEYEKALRQLIKEYPQRDEPYSLLLILGAESTDDKARAIATEMLADPVSDAVKEKANAILNRLNAVGKPFNLKFTALDGREVDLSQMKGNVVLVDFWATWCGPCVGEIPHVKEAYDKFHSRGFEVVGISFDNDQHALQDFVKARNLPWPQYFDGKQWGNKIGAQYAIESIPTMWLVNKQGILCDSGARNDLQAQVEKLLAE